MAYHSPEQAMTKDHYNEFVNGYYGFRDPTMYAQSTSWHMGQQMRQDQNAPQQQVQLPSFSNMSGASLDDLMGNGLSVFENLLLIAVFGEFLLVGGALAGQAWKAVPAAATAPEWVPIAVGAVVLVLSVIAMKRWRKKRIDRFVWNTVFSAGWAAIAFMASLPLLGLVPIFAFSWFLHYRISHMY